MDFSFYVLLDCLAHHKASAGTRPGLEMGEDAGKYDILPECFTLRELFPLP
jgi:hypothetical protein